MMKSKIYIIICVFISLGLFLGCNSKGIKSSLDKVDIESNFKNSTNREIVNRKSNEYKIKDDFILLSRIKNNVFLVNDANNKDLLEYNIENGKECKMTSVYDKEKFIDIVDSNENWIVWVEHESKIVDTSNLPFKWNIVSYNIKSKEKKIVEKSTFKSRKEENTRYSYTPLEIKIQNNNIIYTRPYEDEGKLKIDIVLYDLTTEKPKILETISNIPENNIENISFDNNKVAWNKVSGCADGKDNPKYNFPYEEYNICIYDLETNKKDEIKFNDSSLYYSPKIYNNDISLIKVYHEKEFYSELVVYNIDSKEVKTIASEEEKIYSKNNSDTLKSNQVINESYIGWREDGNGNLYVYDRDKDNFIDLLNKKENENEENYSIGNICNIWDEYVYILGQDKNGDNINSIYKLE